MKTLKKILFITILLGFSFLGHSQSQKLEVIGNYLIITDLVNSTTIEYPLNRVKYRNSGNTIFFIDVDDASQNINFPFSELSDSTGTLFVDKDAVLAFLRDNTGKSSAADGAASEPILRILTAYNGVISGVNNIVTINADPTKFDVASFKYRFIDNTDPEIPIETIKIFPGATAIAGTLFGQGVTNHVYINNNDQIIQDSNAQGGISLFDSIVLGNLNTDPTDLFFTDVTQTTQTGYGIEPAMEALLRRFGGVNLDGCVFSGNADLTMAKTEGSAIGVGRGYNVDFNTAHIQVTSAESIAGSIVGFVARVFENSSGNFIFAEETNKTIDPGQYNNSGVLATVNSSQFSIQRLFYFYGSDLPVIYYGNAVYNSLADAEMAINTEIYEEHERTFESTFRGHLIVRGNATNLSDPSQAKFRVRPRSRI